MKNSSYNLITPVKNEENYLPNLVQNVINQTHLPKVWVIIDDGSNDKTPEILNKLTRRYDWIHSYRFREKNKRNFRKHFAKVIRNGFEKSLKLCDDVKYLAKVDADARFHDDTFRKLIKKMDGNKKLAIASPRFMTLKKSVNVECLKNPKIILNNKNILIKSDKKRESEPTDVLRIYRKEFLEEINGFPITDASSEIVNAKAVMGGYDVSFIDDVWCYLTREIGTTLDSDYKRGKLHGYRFYIKHYHPLMLSARLVWSLYENPFRFMGEVVGYLESFINQKERFADSDIIEYYKKERFDKIFKGIIRN